ncbi:MAG: class I SAM-dependent methyltransferase [Herpetosiphon sp.]
MSDGDSPAIDREREAVLAPLIDPWLQHMRWRTDFAAWRTKRIHSEAFQGEALQLTRSVVGTTSGKRLLDLGCGMGGFAVAVALTGADVSAMDYNGAYCRITRARAEQYGLTLPVMQGAGEALPLPAGRFAIVCAWDVIEHVQQPERLLGEAARVLEPGGTLLMTAINRFAFRDPHYHLPLLNYGPRPVAEGVIRLLRRSKNGAVFRDRQALSRMHYYTFGGFSRLAARYGFRVRDLDEERVDRGELGLTRPGRQRMLGMLHRRGLSRPLYRVNRAVYQGTYRLALEKQR